MEEMCPNATENTWPKVNVTVVALFSPFVLGVFRTRCRETVEDMKKGRGNVTGPSRKRRKTPGDSDGHRSTSKYIIFLVDAKCETF